MAQVTRTSIADKHPQHQLDMACRDIANGHWVLLWRRRPGAQDPNMLICAGLEQGLLVLYKGSVIATDGAGNPLGTTHKNLSPHGLYHPRKNTPNVLLSEKLDADDNYAVIGAFDERPYLDRRGPVVTQLLMGANPGADEPDLKDSRMAPTSNKRMREWDPVLARCTAPLHWEQTSGFRMAHWAHHAYDPAGQPVLATTQTALYHGAWAILPNKSHPTCTRAVWSIGARPEAQSAIAVGRLIAQAKRNSTCGMHLQVEGFSEKPVRCRPRDPAFHNWRERGQGSTALRVLADDQRSLVNRAIEQAPWLFPGPATPSLVERIDDEHRLTRTLAHGFYVVQYEPALGLTAVGAVDTGQDTPDLNGFMAHTATGLMPHCLAPICYAFSEAPTDQDIRWVMDQPDQPPID